MSNGQLHDPEDAFAHTRMSFGDHIEELRKHLWRAILGFLVAFGFSFFIGWHVLEFIKAPVEAQLKYFALRRIADYERKLENDQALVAANQPTKFFKMSFYWPQLEKVFKNDPTYADMPRPVAPPPKPPEGSSVWGWFGMGGSAPAAPAIGPDEVEVKDGDLRTLYVRLDQPAAAAIGISPAQQAILGTAEMTTLNVQEAMMVYIKVCIGCGIVLGSPWIFWQLWSFIAAGLYPQEKRLVHYYMPFSIALFIGGVVLCEIFVIPKAVEALLWFNEWLGLKPDLRLNEWMGFAIFMPLVFGLSFQTPLVMLFLEKVGIMGPDNFRKWRRYIWFAMAIFAALLTPSTDPFSMVLLWLPMGLLFEVGIWLTAWSARGRATPAC